MSSFNDLNDMSLLDLFLMETDRQCVTMFNELAVLTAENSSACNIQTLQRAVHSIKGAARIVELKAVVELATAMETALSSQSNILNDENLKQAFSSCLEQLQIISKLDSKELRPYLLQHKNIFINLIRNLTNDSSVADEAQVLADEEIDSSQDELNKRQEEDAYSAIPSDMSLFQIFKDDANNHLTVLADNLLQIENNPQDHHLLESSMRAVHSLKGAARIIELNQVVQLAHLMEDFFVAAQNNKLIIAPGHIDHLLNAVDLFKDLIRQNSSSLKNWLVSNHAKITGLESDISTLRSEPVKTQADSKNDETEQANAPQETDPNDDIVSLAPVRQKTHSAQDATLRVSSQAMSKLMGLAGEAMLESRWLPTFVSKTFLLKKYQDDIARSVSKIRKHLIEQGLSSYLDSRFVTLGRKINSCNDFTNSYLSELDDHARSSTDIAYRLQREVIFNRMQPFSEGMKGLPRMIRDLARTQGKKIQMKVKGSETMVDRDILEKLEAPLTHIITNAIDHGIETPGDRKLYGKKETATINIEASHQSGMLHIIISDDGKGIDIESLRRKVIAKKLVSEKIARDLSETELQEFIFLPNFSTKSSVNKTSGRGVGLDIVYNTIRAIRGSIQVSSIANTGTYFEMRLPLTLSIIRGLAAEINGEPYSFPLVNIDHVTRVSATDIKEIEGRQYIIHNNKRIGIVSAQQVLELKEKSYLDDEISIVILNNDLKSYGIIVDKLQGIRDLVVHPLTPRLGKLRSISAAAIAEDGTPILILDVQDLLTSMDQLISGNRLKRLDPVTSPQRSEKKRILVVDDSITVREVERKLLTERGYEVEVAVDGLEAWSFIRQFQYELIITDVDMPHMDGIELLLQIKDNQTYENIPVIIVSYKDRLEDRNRGLDAGADYYLTKGSFDDQTLLEAVADLIGTPEEAL